MFPPYENLPNFKAVLDTARQFASAVESRLKGRPGYDQAVAHIAAAVDAVAKTIEVYDMPTLHDRLDAATPPSRETSELLVAAKQFAAALDASVPGANAKAILEDKLVELVRTAAMEAPDKMPAPEPEVWAHEEEPGVAEPDPEEEARVAAIPVEVDQASNEAE